MTDKEQIDIADLFPQRKEHLAILRQGVEIWNQWRKENPNIQPSLWEANFSNSHLNGVDFSGTNLVGAYFTGASLKGANLRGAFLYRADLRGVDLSNANLRGADLSGATLIGTDLSGAVLVDCKIHGAAVWGVRLDDATQQNLLVTDYGEPAITVDDLEVAQFIYLLLDHKKLRNVLNAVTKRGVLLLGRFGGGGLEILQAVASKLREMSYLPIIFDFELPNDRNFTETVQTLVGLCRFVIADLSGPSIPQELYATVPHFKIPLVPIIEAGGKRYAMSVDIFEYPWVINPPVEYTSTDELLDLIPAKVIAPAEEKHQARQNRLNELFE